MAKDLISRYIWIVDTILSHRRLTKNELNELWMKSHFSNGDPMADRTFYSYRRGIEECFNIDIICDPDGAYRIDTDDSPEVKRYASFLLDSNAATNVMQELGTTSGRVEMEDVPSARAFLPIAAEAIRTNHKVVFTYAGFSRSRPEIGILFSPYFLKLYKQRWYMYGQKEGGSGRTYALDRVTEMEVTDLKFRMPASLKASDIFGDIVGVTETHGDIYNVVLQTTITRAKYLRALPLHHSQNEEVHDFYSIFSYRLKLNYELVSEIMAMGSDVKVLVPRELQAMIIDRLRCTLANYTFPAAANK